MEEELKQIAIKIDNSLLIIRKELEELAQLRIEINQSINKPKK